MKDAKAMALYRKYRGLSFDDIVGQEHITDVLQQAISDGRISHGYLFTGPHGVGKTSVARILAHAVNGLQYKHEDNHIDIIEIDAASNRRIDEIRDLREKAFIAPVQATYKVYIIDEVHMLTKEAFNALLKTLEEPPAHVVFILATTEAHKVPQTIMSRTQRHTFKPIPEAKAVAHLQHIANNEDIQIDEQALTRVAKYGKGSFRDAISMLDQLRGSSSEEITVADVESMLGLASENAIETLVTSTIAGDSTAITSQLQELFDTGMQPELLAEQLVESLREQDSYIQHLGLVQGLLDVSSHMHPSLKLELVLLSQNASESQTATPAKPAPKAIRAPAPTITTDTVSAPNPNTEPVAQKPPKTESKPAAKPTKTAETAEITAEHWNDIVAAVKAENNAIASILRAEQPDFTDEGLVINVRFGFHKKKLEDTANEQLIRDAMVRVAGGVAPYTVAVSEAVKAQAAEEQAEEASMDAAADSIIATFGGGERVNL